MGWVKLPYGTVVIPKFTMCRLDSVLKKIYRLGFFQFGSNGIFPSNMSARLNSKFQILKSEFHALQYCSYREGTAVLGLGGGDWGRREARF